MEKYRQIFLPTGQAGKFSCLPDRQANFQIDLLSLFANEKGQTEDFLSKIIAKERILFSCTDENRSILRSIYFSAMNQLKTAGASKLNISYPYYFIKSADSLLYQPVLFIPIEVNAEIAEEEAFSITTSQNGWHLNEDLLLLLERRHAIDLSVLRRMQKASEHIDDVLLKFTDLLSTKTGIAFSYAPNPVSAMHTPDQLADEPDFETLFFNAAISNVEAAMDQETVLDFHQKDPAGVQSWYKAGLGVLDIAQSSAVKIAVNAEKSVLLGNAGTGKTYTIAHVISAAMAEGKRILVVSERLKSLLQIQQQLEKWQLGTYSFILKDEILDLPLLVSIASAKVSQKTELKTIGYDAKTYEIAISQLQQDREKLSEIYANLQRDMVVAPNWQQLVGLYLKSERIESRQSLQNQLHPSAFEFNNSEYTHLRAALERGQPLFAHVNSLQHPLSDLHPRLFSEVRCSDALLFVEKKRAQFEHHLQQIVQRIEKEQIDFRQQQADFYRNRFDTLNALVGEIRTRCEAGLNLYGTSYSLKGLFSRILSLFSKKEAVKRELRKEITEKFSNLKAEHQIEAHFNFEFKGAENQVAAILQMIQQYHSSLKQWYDTILEQLEGETAQLGKDSTPSSAHTAGICLDFEHLLRDINSAQLFAETIALPKSQLTDYKKLAVQLLETLHQIKSHCNEFEAFYAWQQHYLNNDDNFRIVVKSLIEGSAKQWAAAFDSWYFYQLLQKNYSSSIPHHLQNFDALIAAHQEITKLLPQRIIHSCEQRKKDAIRQNERSIFTTGNRTESANSLKSVFDKEQQILTELFPVIFATAELAGKTLTEVRFDLLIFDDAQLYSTNEVGALQYRQVLVTGDDFALSNQNDSILTTALNAGCEGARLGMIHATEDDDMNAFLDAIYPGESFHLPHSKASNFFEAIYTGGFFNEKEHNNEIEAEKVLFLLNRIEKLPNNRYPSVGIVCSTVQQRDLISSLLLKIKQTRSAGYEKIQQLERNNFGVFHWSECIGMHFEIAIVSFTYGVKDDKGRLCLEIQLLNDVNGPESLYLQLTRATKQLIFCHSIPVNYLVQFSESPNARGTFLLSQCFSYFESVQKSADGDARALLSDLAALFGTIDTNHTQILTAEIAIYLSAALGHDRVISEANFGSVAMPLLIMPVDPANAGVIIRVDGTFTLPYTPDPVWEAQLEAKIKSYGYEIVDTWSADWWHDPKAACESLLAQLNENKSFGIPINERIDVDDDSPLIDMAYHIDEDDPMFAEKVSDNTEHNEAGAEPTDS